MLCRYLLRVTVTRGYGASTEKDFFIWVRNYAPPPPPSNHPPIKVVHLMKPCLRVTWSTMSRLVSCACDSCLGIRHTTTSEMCSVLHGSSRLHTYEMLKPPQKEAMF